MRKAIWQRVMAAGFLDKVNPVPLICLKGLDRVYMIPGHDTENWSKYLIIEAFLTNS